MSERDLEAAAVTHGARGYHVFPVRPRSKEPHARTQGVYDATTDERAILHAWDRYGERSNIAVAPTPSGAFILDIDAKDGADPEDVLTDLELDLRDLVIVWTGTAGEPDELHPRSLPGVRGAHVWFRGRAPTGKLEPPGCEIRGAPGGYGLLPPSVHPCGDRYEGALPPVAALPTPPAVVLDLVGSMPSNAVKVEDGAVFESPGRHEHLLAWARSRYTAHGVLGEAALMGMLGKNLKACRPPLPESEVRRLWRHLEQTRIARRERQAARLIAGWMEDR